MIPAQPYMPWKVGGTILHVMAIASTIFRLVNRYRKGCMWWDDYIAIIPGIIFEPMYLALLWVRLHQKGNDYYTLQEKVTHQWISTISFMSIVWLSRISLAMAIARLLSSFRRLKQLAIGMSIFYFLCYMSFIMAGVIHCVTDTSWHRVPGPTAVCRSMPLAIAGVIVDIISDILLIAVPSWKIWNIQLPQRQRIMILSVFFAGFCSLLAAVNFCIWTMGSFSKGPGRALIVVMVSHLEGAICVIVCNIQVVLPSIYRAITGNKDSAGSTSHGSQPLSFAQKSSTRPTAPTYVLSTFTEVSPPYKYPTVHDGTPPALKKSEMDQ